MDHILVALLHSLDPILLTLVLSFMPALFYSKLLYSLNVYRNGPLMLVFFWGACVATTAALFANTWLISRIQEVVEAQATAHAAAVTTDVIGASIVAPVVEESLKGLAVLVVYLVFRKEFTSVLDGVVYGGIAALGFAATENVLYIFFLGYIETILEGGNGITGVLEVFVLRVILGAWGHAFATAFTGIGLALAFLRRHILFKTVLPVLGWMCAVFLHAVHNGGAMFLAQHLPHILYVAALLAVVEWFGFALLLWVIGSVCHDETRWYRDVAAW